MSKEETREINNNMITKWLKRSAMVDKKLGKGKEEKRWQRNN